MIEKIREMKLIVASLLFISILIMTAGCNFIGGQTPNTPETLGGWEQSPGNQFKAALAVPEEIPLCSPVELEFMVTNLSDQAVYLLDWYTPLEGILGDIFRVIHNGQELEYLGPQVTRMTPLADQYVLIEAGGSKMVVVDLSSVYDFSQVGQYEIAYQSPLISHVVQDPSEFATTLDELGPVEIPSQPVEVEIIAENGKHCQSNVDLPTDIPEDETTPPSPLFTLIGVVKEVSLSAQLIRLEKEVEGFSTIALTEDTTVRTASGSLLELDQIHPGLTVKVSGRPGENQALIAHSIRVVPPEEKSK